MATVSFDKNIVINESEAVSMLVDSLISDEPREINKELASSSEIERGKQLLTQCLSLSRN